MATYRHSADTIASALPLDVDESLGTVGVPSAEILLFSDYDRVGSDLLLTGPNGTVYGVPGYFDAASPPDLTAPNGATLEADLVAKLAGSRTPAQLAQAGDAAAAQPIGEVVSVAGSVQVTRATGEQVVLDVGDPVFQNDVIETAADANVGISFLDETVLTVNAGSRMVLDDLVYQPADDSAGSMLLSLVSGSFAFISGEIAPNGDMVMRTPVTTLGIRGTAGAATYDLTANSTQVFNFVDPRTGDVSRIEIYDSAGNLLGVLTTSDTYGAYDGESGVFVQTFLSAEQQQFADEILGLLEQAAEAAGIDVTQATDQGNRRVVRLDTDGEIIGALSTDGLEGTDLDDGTPPEEGGADDDDDGGSNRPPVVTAINGPPTDEDAPLYSINLLTGQFDPEGAPLSVSGVSVASSDGRPVIFELSGSTLTIDPNQFDDLALGEGVAISVQYSISDGVHVVANTASFVLGGRNDTPVVVIPPDPQDLTEAAGTTGSTQSRVEADNTIAFSDDDLNDIELTGNVDEVEIVGVTNGFDAALTREGATGDTLAEKLLSLDLFTITDVTKELGENDGSVSWDFDAPDRLFDYLAEGQTVTFTYTIELNDQEGVIQPNPDEGEVSSTVILLDVEITITGTNDVAVITSSPGDHAGAVDEAEEVDESPSLTQSTSGTIRFTDVDLADNHTASFTVPSAGTIGGAQGTNLNGYTLTAAQVAALVAGFALTTGPGSAVTSFDSDGTSPTAAEGTLGWTYDIDDADIDFLGAGDSVELAFTVTVADNSGATDGTETVTQDVTITVTGTNDEPVVTSDDVPGQHSGAVDEADEAVEASGLKQKDTGTVTFSDVDLSDDHVASVTGRSVDGSGTNLNGYTLTAQQEADLLDAFGVDAGDGNPVTSFSQVTGTGTVDWTYEILDTDLDFLGANDVVTLVFEITIDDGQGGTVIQDVTITVTGTNDAPTVTGTQAGNGVTEAPDGSQDEATDVLHKDGGTISFADVDLSDGHTVPAVLKSATDSANGAVAGRGTFTAQVTDTTAGDGVGEVSWEFSVNDSAIDDLADGQTITQVYTVTVNDGNGGTVDQDVTVVITGTNDAPVILGETTDDEGSVKEKAEPGEGGVLSSMGTVSFDDVDLIDTHSASVGATVKDGGGSPIASPLGVLTLDPVNQGADTVKWTFSVNDADLDFLADGETLTQVYTVTVDDGNGGTVDQEITITIEGTNDAPVISIEAGDSASATVAETDSGLTASDTLTVSDVDVTDQVTTSVVSVVASGNGAGPSAPGNLALLAMLTVAPATILGAGQTSAALTWSFDSGEEAFNYLAVGDSLILTYSVKAEDGDGANDTQDVIITITGTNDAPVIDAVNNPVAPIAEDGTFATPQDISATGSVLVSDADIGDTLTGVVIGSATAELTDGEGTTDIPADPQVAALIANGALTFDSTVTSDGGQKSLGYTYKVDGADLDFLSEGDTLELTYDLNVGDGTADTPTETVTVTVTGAADTPQTYEIESGAVEIGFTVCALDGVTTGTTDPNSVSLQTLFSRDSTFRDGGGHLTAWVDGDGSILVRHQTLNVDYFIKTEPGLVAAGESVRLVYTFDPENGMQLHFSTGGDDPVLVGSNSDPVTSGDPVSLIGNQEPWTLGASQVSSDDAVANELSNFLDGSIDSFSISAEPVVGGEPLGEWLFDDDGTPGADTSGNGNDAIFKSGASQADGVADLTDGDGFDNDYIEIPNLISPAAAPAIGFAVSGSEFFGNEESIEVTGTDGADVIKGGPGDDFLAGGGGPDTYVLEMEGGLDTVLDFEPGSDRLDLSDLLDANFDPDTNRDEYIKTDQNDEGDTIVSVDFDGAGTGSIATDVAALNGVAGGTTIDVVFDDNGNTTTVTV